MAQSMQNDHHDDNPQRRFSNPFATLHVFEPEEVSPNDTADVRISASSKDDPETQQDKEALVREHNEALNDFNQLHDQVLILRKKVNILWGEYIRALHPHAIAVASNTAIDLAREMEEKIALRLDRFGGVGEFVVSRFRKDLDKHCDDDGSETYYKVAKVTMFEAQHLLEIFRMACLKMRSKTAGVGGTSKFQRCTTKYSRDHAGFLEVLSEATILISKLKWDNVQDEFTRGVRLIMADPTKPLS
ncbi:hypothetical protein QBC35DRAFT_465363 [Podospora australis]|uniref:DUF6604 domain-containing protein n=1 Tax=Podospora australis TaxID=1536484 RepID=A0AAN7AH32_9PEZI|nr:hypothetical protein QBC35DRAFT_465363 [Podospora australis]